MGQRRGRCVQKKKREKRDRARTSRCTMPPRESRGSSKSRASLLFGEEEEEEEEEEHLRCAHALCIERENEQNVLTSKLFALNPFDAGVANAKSDFDDIFFSPTGETCVSPKRVSSSKLVFKAATTTTPGKATTQHKAATKAQKNTTPFKAHLLRARTPRTTEEDAQSAIWFFISVVTKRERERTRS